MRRFRVVRGELDSAADRAARADSVAPQPNAEPLDPALARRMRSLYAAPGDGYWDGLEATIMAAVRAGPTAAVEWWHTLAAWARPGLAAAAVILGVVGGVTLQTQGARRDLAARSVLEPLDEDLARASDPWAPADASAEVRREARAAAELLSDGVQSRRRVPSLQFDAAAAAERAAARQFLDEESLRANRDSVFSAVIP